ncbi:hypothetical protein [Synechococcus sp. CCY 9618]|uniref:hypothetical protein n=1 Tax=Synechococcus sp. CCY 9618 TaxID=2815602 RepID=UPI001C24277F|nr:hypothetical protein [Synechococcus sp. CCY 9618]
MRLLIDEILSSRLARWATYMAPRMTRSSPMPWPAVMEVHPGVIALREAGLSAEQQWLRVQSALQLIQHGNDTDLINRVIEIQAEAVHVWHEMPAS